MESSIDMTMTVRRVSKSASTAGRWAAEPGTIEAASNIRTTDVVLIARTRIVRIMAGNDSTFPVARPGGTDCRAG